MKNIKSEKTGNMNMVEVKESKLFILGIFPKCPFYKPVPLLINLVIIALGTVGIYFLNLWAAVVFIIYSILFYFIIMPVVHCQYCYYKVKETTTDSKNGKNVDKLLPLEKWKESYLPKHVACGKKVSPLMFIIWFLPIVLIPISFFLNFSLFALLSLIGLIAVLAGNYFYMRRYVCTTCTIQEECHSAF